MKNEAAEKHFGYPITIRRLAEGCFTNGNSSENFDGNNTPIFEDKETGEIRCFNGHLNPRPSYQREFVYSTEDQVKVFETIHRAFPLGIMYWCDDGNGDYELIDGQQRTISILNILADKVPIKVYDDSDGKYFSELAECEKDQILDQELLVYICSGDVNQKMDWFTTINIAGKALTAQELRSAVYSGPFVSDARIDFVSKAKTKGLSESKEYYKFVTNSVLRQDLLEDVLRWHANFEDIDKGTPDKNIRAYLKKHRYDKDASELFDYYENVLTWAKNTFGTKYQKELPKIEWGLLYNKYHNIEISAEEIRKKVDKLMANPEVEKKTAIFEYVFSGEEKILHARDFDESDKRSKFEEQKHICAICNREIPNLKSAEADHITPWSKGGKTNYSNLQILCIECNRKKKDKEQAEAREEFTVDNRISNKSE